MSSLGSEHFIHISILQKAAIRIINFVNFQGPSSPLFARNKILKFSAIVKSLNILLVQCLNQHALLDLFNFRILGHSIQTRGATNQTLTRPCVKSTTFGLMYTYRCILDWNDIIPAHPNINLINAKLRSFIKISLSSNYDL